MHPNERDVAGLWDMLKYASLTIGIVEGTTFEQYCMDRIKQLALERAMEVMGESAGRISSVFRDAHPEIPWRRIIAQRNVLAHEYGEIRQERLWETATIHVPELVRSLKRLKPARPCGSDPKVEPAND